MEVTVELGLAELIKKRVRYIWKMDRETYKNCQRIKDANGIYAWVPDFELNTPGTFLGCQISIVEKESFEIVVVAP